MAILRADIVFVFKKGGVIWEWFTGILRNYLPVSGNIKEHNHFLQQKKKKRKKFGNRGLDLLVQLFSGSLNLPSTKTPLFIYEWKRIKVSLLSCAAKQ